MDNDVLRQAPLFSALDDEAATALRASMAETRLRRGDVLFHEGDSGDKLYIVTRRQGEARPHLLRRPREPPRDPRPRPDVRRAVALRPRPALGHRHRRHRHRRSPRSPTRTCCAGSRAARPSPAACSPRSPAGCARPTTSSPTWSSPTSPAASPRRCSTSPTASAAPPTTASTSTTTSPRRSSPSWSAPPARRSTRRSPTSPPAAGCASSPAPS